MTTKQLKEKAAAFERLERFCRKYPFGVRILIAGPEDENDSPDVSWSIAGKMDGDFTEDEEYYGDNLLNCIERMPK